MRQVSAAVLMLLAAVRCHGQDPVYAKDVAGRVTVRATRVAAPIKVDGRLDEEAYTQVEALTTFIQAEPQQGSPSSERTEAWVLFDDDNLYLACRCWDQHPERMIANEMRRDSPNLRNNDNFAVALDTFHDRRNGFLFTVTPLGAFFDALTIDERTYNSDWNTVWQAKAGRFEGGWIAEIAIPFKSLRYPPGADQTWGINIRRNIRAKNEWTYIVPMRADWGQGAIFRVSAAATLTGLRVPPSGKNLEIKPYAISRLSTDLVTTPRINNQFERDAGLDVKYGISKGLTADLTYNTDFAQVEEDEAQVNLTRFNLVFPEKREFFLEGAGTFTFGTTPVTTGGAPPPPGANPPAISGDAPAVFYSRRIGLNGARAVPIVAGARLSGKAGAWNIGALTIQSDNDAAGAVDTNFTVLRIRRDIMRRSTIGGIFTGRSASISRVGSNQAWGLDASFAFSQNVYLSGFVAQTKTTGRPGRDYSYRTLFTYTADKYGLTLDRIEAQPNFNPEIGFMRRLDFREHIVNGRFSPRPVKSRFVRRYFYEGSFTDVVDTSGAQQSRTTTATYRVELQNSDLFSVTYSKNFEYLPAPFAVATGVRIPIGGYDFRSVLATYNPGQQHRLSGSGSIEIGTFYNGDKKTAASRGRASLTTRLAVEPNISLNWIDLPQKSFTNTVVGERTLYSMTPRMFVTALVQYASSTLSLSANIRFRWEYMPGSELFVVYTEGRDTSIPGTTALQNRGFVVKINKLLRF
jgi:Domain of unknown function (DUF5916)/Carbohydrate family 9 binding domain-like